MATKINLTLGNETRVIEARETKLENRPVLNVTVNGTELTLRDRSALHEYSQFDILIGAKDTRF